MINRISEIPFWGPEEQIRRFINKHDDPLVAFNSASAEILGYALRILRYSGTDLTTEQQMRDKIKELIKNNAPETYTEAQKEQYFEQHIAKYLPYQQTITQQRIGNLDQIYQKQLIWSYGLSNVDDAYFYQDWCPIGEHTEDTSYNPNPKWQMDLWGEAAENVKRSMDRSFDYTTFKGYQKSELRGNEMPSEYDASKDVHTRASTREQGQDDDTDLDANTLRHNIMWSYLEVSEWLGDGAANYGSQNGFVSRKMSLSWLFNAIKALINWKLANQDKWAEADIHPLVTDEYALVEKKDGWTPKPNTSYYRKNEQTQSYDLIEDGDYGGTIYTKETGVHERFLNSNEPSTQGYTDYDDYDSLNQMDGCCMTQQLVRAKEPWINGVQKVRGNEYHYGERAWFYTHTSFIGECRFYHNARFLGQATFDKEINGTAMRSRWADLAEYKEGDRKYEPGTLVMFGGDKEITVSDGHTCHAIVTTKPGLVLNADDSDKAKNMVGIALVGTVPVNVCENIEKFDKLVPSSKYRGYARRRRWYDFFKKTIGIAMADRKGGQVLCMTKMEF